MQRTCKAPMERVDSVQGCVVLWKWETFPSAVVFTAISNTVIIQVHISIFHSM